jgi:hypothetical protein
MKDDEKELELFLIHPKSSFKTVWNPILIFLLLYTATIMPYRVAFEDVF